MNIKCFAYNSKSRFDLKYMENICFLSNSYLSMLMDNTDMNDPSNQEPTFDFQIHYDPFPGQMYHPHKFCFETYEN